ncbi:MAG: DsbC family protein [Pseudomonadota bacterium]
MNKTSWILGLIAAPLLAFAQDDEFDGVRSAMQSLVPGAEIDSIRPAPFPGFAEVLLGAQLIYISLDGQYLIDGRLIEIATRKDLSEAAKGTVRKDRLAGVSNDERFVFPTSGEPKHRLTIFTDIDCGYCRRLHQQMAEYNDLGIEVTYLMFPRAGIGSTSFNKAISVWCADDRNDALTLAKSGQDPESQSCDNPIEEHYQLGRELGVSGTPALVAEDGTLIPGYVPPGQLIERLEALSAE